MTVSLIDLTGLLTNTAEGLAKSQEVFETSRSDVPRVLVTVTDGVSANPVETIEMAEEVRRDFTYSVLVGIGLGTDLDSLNPEFQAIATNRDSTILYDSALEFTLGFQNVLDRICPGRSCIQALGSGLQPTRSDAVLTFKVPREQTTIFISAIF